MKSKVFKVFRVLMALASVSFLLHFWGFEKNNSQPVIYAFPGKERPVSNVWTSGEKGYLWVNPVNIKYYEIKKPNNVRIHYCQISGLRDYRVQQAINDDIYRSVLQCSNGEFNGKKEVIEKRFLFQPVFPQLIVTILFVLIYSVGEILWNNLICGLPMT